MGPSEAGKPVVLWFGLHRGKALADIPDGYLRWAAEKCETLTPRVRAAVVAELARRGVAAPPPPPPKPEPRCRDCGPAAGRAYEWAEDRAGRKVIRRSCSACGRWLGAAPQTPENVAAADRTAALAPALDALILAAECGVSLVNDGAAVAFAGDGWHRATPELRQAVHQCKHSLARLLPLGVTSA